MKSGSAYVARDEDEKSAALAQREAPRREEHQRAKVVEALAEVERLRALLAGRGLKLGAAA